MFSIFNHGWRENKEADYGTTRVLNVVGRRFRRKFCQQKISFWKIVICIRLVFLLMLCPFKFCQVVFETKCTDNWKSVGATISCVSNAFRPCVYLTVAGVGTLP